VKSQYVDIIQLRPKSIIIYPEKLPPYNSTKSIDFTDKLNLLSTEKYTGQITNSSLRNLTKALDIFYQVVPQRKVFNSVINKFQYFKCSFVTLTLSDKYAVENFSTISHKLLNTFLTRLRQSNRISLYVWKAELQLNGNVHYHLISDLFLPYNHLRGLWNSVQNNLGLIDKFNDRYSHRDPNSTDIKSILNYEVFSKYLQKYIVKPVKSDISVNGKIFDCSKILKSVKYPTDFAANHFHDNLEFHLLNGNLNRFISDRFTVYTSNRGDVYKYFPDTLKQVSKSFYANLRNEIYDKDLLL